MSTMTLEKILAGCLMVTVSLRTPSGVEQVASGHLLESDRRGNQIGLADRSREAPVWVRLGPKHLVSCQV